MAELRSLGFAGQKTWDKRQRRASLRFADNGQQNLGFATLRQTKDMRLTTKGIGLSSFDF